MERTNDKNSRKRRAAFFAEAANVDRVFGKGRRERVAAATSLYPEVINLANIADHLDKLDDLEIIFSTWGMPRLEPLHLDKLPSLKAVFHAAGSVQHFADPLLERGIRVVSAWQANAVPVAEYTLAQILLSTKGVFQNMRENRSNQATNTKFSRKGNFGETISILGAGAIGSRLIEFLRPFNLQIIVFDPFLSEEKAKALGVERVTLEEAFARGYVVSNHLANLPETRQILTQSHFASMRTNATFINTGRGATVDEKSLIHIFRDRNDLTALLDVTDPEPPEAGSALRELPNIFLTSHLAGSLGDELVRMADYCLEEFTRWDQGLPLKHEVLSSMLKTMA